MALTLALSIGVAGAVIADPFIVGYASSVNDRSERPLIGAFEQRLKPQGFEYELEEIKPAANRRPSIPRLLLTLG